MLISAVGVSSLRYNIIGANKLFTWMVLLFLLTESFSQVRPCGDQDWTLLGCIYYPLFIRVKSLIEMCTSFPRESWLKPRLCWVHIWTPLGSGPDSVGFKPVFSQLWKRALIFLLSLLAAGLTDPAVNKLSKQVVEMDQTN